MKRNQRAGSHNLIAQRFFNRCSVIICLPVAGCADARLLRMFSNVLCHSMNSNCTLALLEKRDSSMRVQFCFIAVM